MKAVYINALLITVMDDTLTYEEICQLAPGVTEHNPTVQYTRGNSDKPSGTLQPGQTLALKDAMVIDVAFTGLA